MAWHIFIFLKSIENLEDFRKNPRVQFPQNLLVQFSKVLPNPKFKRNLKRIIFLLELARFQLSAQPASRPLSPTCGTHPFIFLPGMMAVAATASRACARRLLAPLPLP
jgi:hypothetical protein